MLILKDFDHTMDPTPFTTDYIGRSIISDKKVDPFWATKQNILNDSKQTLGKPY